MSEVHNLVRPHVGFGMHGRAMLGDVILDTLLRITERWPLRSGGREIFVRHVIDYARPLDLRAAVTSAIAGGHEKVIEIFFQHPSPLSRWPAADVLPLLHELLDHGHGSHIRGIADTDMFKELAVNDVLALLQRLAATAASPPMYYFPDLPQQAAHFSKQEVLSLADTAIANGHFGLAEQLIQLPLMQSLSSMELHQLLQQAVSHDSDRLFYRLSRHPKFQQLTVPLLLDLLQLHFLLRTSPTFGTVMGSLHLLPAETLGQLIEAAMLSGNAELFAALTDVSSVLRPPNYWELLEKAVTEGHELAACNLLRLPEARHLPQGLLQGLKELAADKGQEVVQLGLGYLLRLQQLEASTSS